MDENTANLQVGYGIAKGEQALEVGTIAARQAVQGIKKKGLTAILVFASVRYDLKEVLRGIHGVVGQAPVMGATTAGEICDGPQQGSVVVVALASPYLKVRVGVGQGVSQDWQQAVTQAVNTPEVKPFFDLQDTGIWPEMTRQGKSAFGLLFSPGNTGAADSRSFEVLEELKRLSLNRLPIIGGAAADDWRLETNYVLWGRQAYPDSVLVAVFETQLQFGIAMAHGFQPTSRKATVTRSQNHKVLELDGKPAADVYSQLLCISRVALEGKHLTLTTKRPAGIADAYGQYSLNVASFFTPEHDVRFSQPMVEGTVLTIMDADQSSLLAAGGEGVRKAMLRGGITDPAIVLAFSCALRSHILEGWLGEEIAAIRKMLPTTPVVGFYSFGEQGVADDGVNRHNNEVVATLVIDRELSHGARVALENAQLQQELEQRRLELTAANDKLHQEIAERRRTEEEFQKSEERYHNLVDNITVGISLIDRDYRIILMNTSQAKLFHKTAREFIGKQCFKEFEKRPGVCPHCPGKVAMATGQPAEAETVGRRDDGSTFPVRIHAFPSFGPDGQITGFIEVVEDIAGRKHAEEALRESEQRFRDVSEYVAEWIWETDAQGRYTYSNSVVEHVLGYKPEEVLGKHFYDFLHPDAREKLKQENLAILVAKQPFREFHNRYLHKQGATRWFSTSGVPILDDRGNLLGYRGIAIDITARREAETNLSRQHAVWAGISQIFREALFCATETELGRTCLRVAEQLTESRFGWIGELNRTGRFDTIAISNPGWADCRMPESEATKLIVNMELTGLFGKVLTDGQSLIANDPASHPDRVGIPAGHPPLTAFLGVPLKLAGKTIGMIGLANKEGGYGAADREEVKSLAGATVEALMRHRVESRLRQNEEWFRQIYESAPVMMHSIDPAGIIRQVNAKWLESLGYSREEVIGKKISRFMTDESAQRCCDTVLPQFRRDGFIKDIPCQFVRKDGEVLEGLLDCTRTRDPSGKPIGLAVVRDITGMKQTENGFRQANEQLQSMVAESERRNREITQINSLSEMLQSCRQVKETYLPIAQSVQELFPARSGALFILDPARNLVETEVLWGDSLAGEPVFAPDDCWALQRGKLHIGVAGNQGPHCRHLAAAPAHGYLCLPLQAGEELFGLVHVQGLGDLTPERSESLRGLAMTVADHISLSLSNLKLRDTLRHQALHDPLTGLFNRRYLEETLERELRRVQRKEAPLGIIMLDLDHFKRFNDTYGHPAGDNLLRSLGQLLQTQVRQEDVACRYGGEEFVLILPEASLEVVLKRAEEIRRMVPRLQVFQEGELLECTTVSLGVAIFPEHGLTGEDVLRAADDAMYQAKAAGRNRVVAAESVTAASHPSS